MNKTDIKRDKKTIEKEFTRCYLITKFLLFIGMILNVAICFVSICAFKKADFYIGALCGGLLLLHWGAFVNVYSAYEQDTERLAEELDNYCEE